MGGGAQQNSISEEDGEDAFSTNTWLAAPNPATDKVTIFYDLTTRKKNGYLVITDINGRIVKRVELDFNKRRFSIDASNIASGIYFYSLEVDGRIEQTNKLVLIK